MRMHCGGAGAAGRVPAGLRMSRLQLLSARCGFMATQHYLRGFDQSQQSIICGVAGLRRGGLLTRVHHAAGGSSRCREGLEGSHMGCVWQDMCDLCSRRQGHGVQ